jgi:hypothetical protein
VTEEKEAFLDRWSRLKREQPAPPAEQKPAPAAAAKQEPAEPLPPVDKLTPESDFKPFMNPKVDPETRRSALKKLFADSHFNVPDPYEAYSEDYTKGEAIPLGMLKAINRVRDVAVKGEEKVLEEERLAEQVHEQVRLEAEKVEAKVPETPTQEPRDVAGRQDA